jgi:hypothetical protein
MSSEAGNALDNSVAAGGYGYAAEAEATTRSELVALKARRQGHAERFFKLQTHKRTHPPSVLQASSAAGGFGQAAEAGVKTKQDLAALKSRRHGHASRYYAARHTSPAQVPPPTNSADPRPPYHPSNCDPVPQALANSAAAGGHGHAADAEVKNRAEKATLKARRHAHATMYYKAQRGS